MSSTPAAQAPPKAVRGMGPAIIVILIVMAALLGYYQMVYYPSVATTSVVATTTVPVTPHLGNITILLGAPTAPRDLTFYPNVATVYLGFNSTVVWTNEDIAEHTVTANSSDQSLDPSFYAWSVTDAPGGFNNILAKGAPGDTLNFTFTIAGTYGYFCKYHPNMIGTIIVKPASSNLTATGSTTSAGSTSSTSSILGGIELNYFIAEATAFASNLATLTGSGTAP
ncbi:MAG TPA: plastocyanin/azurin family copper-binding protein [Nitrososphaerales archaeon]|nr:plastocyanin/azurin family copper-binding protein [Nitrososphaerales archaeon]